MVEEQEYKSARIESSVSLVVPSTGSGSPPIWYTSRVPMGKGTRSLGFTLMKFKVWGMVVGLRVGFRVSCPPPSYVGS